MEEYYLSWRLQLFMLLIIIPAVRELGIDVLIKDFLCFAFGNETYKIISHI